MISIRTRLKRRLVVSLGAAWFVSFVAAVTAGYLEYREAFEARLGHSGELMLSFASTQKDISFTSPTPEVLAALGETDDYIVVITRAGRALYSSIPISAEEVQSIPERGMFKVEGTLWDLQSFTDATSGTRVTIGVDAQEPVSSTLQVAGTSVLVFFFTTAIVAIAVICSVRNGLRPLDQFATEVRQRSGDNLSPLDEENAPQELKPVAGAINGFMNRLRIAIERERDFVANAAHELRTPIAAIRAQIEAIETKDLPAQAADRLGFILMAAERSGHTITQLLDLSRSQSLDGHPDRLKDADLRRAAEEVIAAAVPQADARNVEVVLEAPSAVPVRTDPDLLAIVLRNLVENAIKYCGTPGRVAVEISAGPETRLTVSDNGSGLDPARFAEAAGKFDRLGRTGRDGAGLGLSIVSEISRHLAIGLSAERAGELGGLCVVLQFPALQE
ncbi:ATP-binding protein [Nisaea acidiphila]|uniref:histidine kinase n=1 Tax=Nisaea acidiphila TaxID=1862145 RepID=A0A9J7ANN8_9PROT|nr:ATP-binding protein [Nisaea acidiphila]UUX48815.1 ATP-binding protein [Nisaea acidiphila]